MLRFLHIHDFVIVERLEIGFEAGFSVFSGETGAGKSILIDALNLALGGRADASLIRSPATKTDISAVFDTPPSLQDWLEEHDLAGPELILRRVLEREGRSRAYINGQPATLGQLREIAAHLVDIHGQHAHQSLLQAASQRDLLDTQAGCGALAGAVRGAWEQWRAAQHELDAAQQDGASRAAASAQLKLEIELLAELAPAPGEWPELCARHARLAHAQALLAAAAQAVAALDGEERSCASAALRSATLALQNMLRHDPALEQPIQALESARILCAEVVSTLNAYAARIEPDPSALAAAEARMGRLFDAARRFQVEPEQLAHALQEREAKLAQLLERQDIQRLEAQCAQAQAHYDELAARLSAARAQTAQRLASQVSAAMQDLAMQGGSFAVALHPGKASAHGTESVEFMVAGHANTPLKPLAKVASGGELARIALALSVIASQAARVPCLIFDEVDTGVGGAVAEVVGRLLRELGHRHQVLCVTHLPQVAACGQNHFLVSKSARAGQTTSEVRALSAAERTEEIARMLGGLKITATTRRHAAEMLALRPE